jgi:chemotaxis protein CheD
MLPRCRGNGGCHEPCVEAFKYMDCALPYMLGRFLKKGVTKEEIEVKIFGGADTLASKSSNSIGSKNVKVALDFMKREKLRVSASDVGDAFGRKIIFGLHTGEVFVKRLKPSHNGKR